MTNKQKSGQQRIVISKALNRIMVKEDLTNKMLAEWAGLHLNTIQRLRAGKTGASVGTLIKIAEVLQVTPEELMKNE